MRRKHLFVLLLAMIWLPSLLGPYWAAGQAERTVEVHNPLLYRLASISNPGSPPFVPSDIRRAYDFLPVYNRGINGTGTRIAIVDAYGDPTMSTDLSSFDSLTGLPTPTMNTYYPDGVPRRCNTSTCA